MAYYEMKRRLEIIVMGLLALYGIGYVVLLHVGFFDLSRLPGLRNTDDWLNRVYWPVEWLRHLRE